MGWEDVLQKDYRDFSEEELAEKIAWIKEGMGVADAETYFPATRALRPGAPIPGLELLCHSVGAGGSSDKPTSEPLTAVYDRSLQAKRPLVLFFGSYT